MPTGREIHCGDRAQHMASPWSDISPSGLGRLPHLLMRLGLDEEEAMLHRALGIVPVNLA